MIWILLLIAVLGLFYNYAVKPLSIWKDLGIKHKKPYPVLGNSYKLAMRQESLLDNIIDMYKQFPNERYNGYFQFVSPMLIIRDLDLIKQIAIKDFDHFTDRRALANAETEPQFSKNLSNLTGQKWRHMRSTLSPAFTSSKMRSMCTLVADCAEQFTTYFLENSGNGNVQEIDMKDAFTRFTNDAIATCAFGVTCDSLKDRENEFFMMGKDATNFKGLRSLKFMMFNFFPRLVKIFKMRLFPAYVSDFFSNIISDTIAMRTEHNIMRPDLIHLLMEAKKGKIEHEEPKELEKGFSVVEESDIGKANDGESTKLTDMDIAAQAFLFFFAGFETTSSALGFMSHELAVNPDVQEKLREEVDQCFENCKGKVTYEAVMKMEYLDMVTSETLRIWPLGPGIDRVCTKEFTIDPVRPGETKVVVKPGQIIFVPIVGMHHDEQYFANPARFDPERFCEENKHNIVPYSYLPFGIGPRSCIASRFALMELKVLMVNLLRKFEIVVTPKTAIPLTLSAASFSLTPERGFWLGLKARN